VTATHPDATGTAGLFVLPGVPDHLVLSPDEATAAAGESAPFTASLADAYGNRIGDVTGDTTFTVDGGSCTGASCSSTAVGDHPVTGTMGPLTGAAVLHVNPGPVHRIVLGGGSASVATGTATAPYSVDGFDAYDNPLGDVTGDVTLSIAPDGTCGADTCTPAAAGPHTVTATHAADTDSASLTAVDASADVRLTKTGPASALPGTDVTYQLSARNFGPGTAADVTVSDPLPAGTTFVSESHPAGWTCTVTATYSCTRPALAPADGAQAFTLVVHVGVTTIGPVSNTASVSASTGDAFPANNTPPAVVTTVGCARTVTGLYAGDLTLSGPGTTCLRNVTVTGKLAVVKGATLVAVDAVIGGAMSATGSGPITFCGSTLRSSVNIDGARGFVLVGDPAGGCAANRMLSSLTADKNTGGVMLGANVLSGRFGCKGNNPAPVNGGQPNTAPSKSGQCSGL
jgi:uncharacterized repeat protein (TIGR01451 family)